MQARENHKILGSHSIHKAGFLAAGAIVALETVQINIIRVEPNTMSPRDFASQVEAKGVGVMVLDQRSVTTTALTTQTSNSSLRSLKR